MTPVESPRPLGPGVRRVIGDDPLVVVGHDDGVDLLRPSSPDRDVLVLHERSAEPDGLLAEGDRLMWLSGRAGAPAVLASGRADTGEEALVVRLAAGARTAARGHPLGPEPLAVAIATTLRELHTLDVAQCPTDAGVDVAVAAARERIGDGRVPPAVAGPYAGRDPAALLETAAERIDSRAEPVMIHGGPRADRIWVEPSGRVVLTGWRRGGVGDRHFDLAAAAVMLHELHGPALVPRFFDAYGLDDVDPVCLDAHQILVHLLR